VLKSLALRHDEIVARIKKKIPATQEVEIRRIASLGHLPKKLVRPPSQQTDQAHAWNPNYIGGIGRRTEDPGWPGQKAEDTL
jgi:hypothetical protein